MDRDGKNGAWDMRISMVAAILLVQLAPACGNDGGDTDSGQFDAGEETADDAADGRTEQSTLDAYFPHPPDDPWKPVSSSDSDFYSAEYMNSVAVGQGNGGQRVIWVAGRHSKHQPYFQKETRWDHLMLVVDDLNLNVAAEVLQGFEVALDLWGEEGKVQFFVDVDFRAPDGSDVHILADFHVNAVFHEADFFGVALGGSPDEPSLGMSHQPAFLSLAPYPPSIVQVDGGPAMELVSLTGELEIGRQEYAQDPGMAYRYDYACLISPDKGYVYLQFNGHALYSDGPFGELLEGIIAPGMIQELTMQGGEFHKADLYGLPDDATLTAGTVLFNHVEDVGLGYMDRQVVQMEDSDSNPVWGLRENIYPKENSE